MGWSKWNTGKKVVLILLCILAIMCIIAGAISILVANELPNIDQIMPNDDNTDDTVIHDNSDINGTNITGDNVNVDKGVYKVKIEAENEWAMYTTTDGNYSQKESSGSQIINLGTVNNHSSITIDQKGNGTTKVSILDSKNNVIIERTNSINNGTIYIFLKVR